MLRFTICFKKYLIRTNLKKQKMLTQEIKQPSQSQQQLSQQAQNQQHEQQNNNDNEQSSAYDQLAIETLKQQVSLTNHQLLELTYNDQKFYQKLKQFNHFGCLYIKRMQFPQALVYLSQAEKILEYAASCGKTIERKLIIATLNNEASLYQKAWQLQKAESYLEAIIYNISSFFEPNSSQYQPQQSTKSLTKLQQFTSNILNEQSAEYQDYSIALWRKKSLVIFYLQYCAINSQNKNNQRAFKSAQKALGLLKQVCMDLYKYEKYFLQNSKQSNIINSQLKKISNIQKIQQKDILFQLANFRQVDIKQANSQTFYRYFKTAVKHIALYVKRIHSPFYQDMSEQEMETYRKCFENYSIGTIMQINPSELDEQADRLDLQQQISLIQKHFKAIYLSVGHFILGTQARFIASQKYTLDQTQRRQSAQFQQSKIYHLCSIIILTNFLRCQSGYFDHIVNSFKNHYKIDLMQQAKQYLERNPELKQDLTQQDILQLFEKQTENKQVFKNVQSQKKSIQIEEIQEIQKLQSYIKTVNQIQIDDQNQLQKQIFKINTEQSQQFQDEQRKIKEKHSGTTKSTKLSKNTISSHASAKDHKHHQNNQHLQNKEHHTASKKTQHKKSVNPLNKNTPKHQITNQMTISHYENKNQTKKHMILSHHQHKYPKNIYTMTSRQKQNKIKLTQLNSNSKASRSKRKSDYQLLNSHRKVHTSHQKITQNNKDRTESKRETIYSKRETDYIPNKASRSKSKNRKMPTSTEGEKKSFRRKDSFGDLRKTKRVQQQYGVVSGQQNTKYLDIHKTEIKTSKHNLASNTNLNNNMKKSNKRKQSEQKNIKLSSPDLKLRKLKSPKNLKR